MHRLLALIFLSWSASPAAALTPCNAGTGQVWQDSNANGRKDGGEAPLPGIKVSDGVEIVLTDANGEYRLPAIGGRTIFVIKPAGYDLPTRRDGLPDFWTHVRGETAPKLKYGGILDAFPACKDFGLLPRKALEQDAALQVLLFADPQTKSLTDVDYYRRDIVEPLLGRRDAMLGLTLGDVVNDDLSLYPALNRQTARLRIPWLHVAGNHDLDFDAPRDEDSLLSFRNVYGPDTFAWEEERATFIGLDDVVYRPNQQPAYVGGFREDQFAFLAAYLPTVPKDRLLVLGMHIPLFEEAGADTFREADRERLFALLRDFPHVLVLSGHSHTQRHWYHDVSTGWHGMKPLHEYNVGAACGAFWSGVKDTAGIPDATMADGTPNGYARLRVESGGTYALSWHAARDPNDSAIGLHAPKVLRRGAYPAWGIYANVYMGDDGTRVEYRVDGGEWKPMAKVSQADPALLAENMRDDLAEALRGYDRSPEAKPSPHLWRAPLPTRLAVGDHRVEVRAQDRWRGEVSAATSYRLQQAAE